MNWKYILLILIQITFINHIFTCTEIIFAANRTEILAESGVKLKSPAESDVKSGTESDSGSGIKSDVKSDVKSECVSCDTMRGKVLCGYQGWFTAEGDGCSQPWIHYQNAGKFEPGYAGIELWPDMSEMGDDEKYMTPFCFSDGTPAAVFSSQNPKTVRRHFQWMREYGLDGVMLQRFPCSPKNHSALARLDAVLENVQNSANAEGRCWALMYDLSGKSDETLETEVLADWKRLVETRNIGKNPADRAYLHHNGKPVVAVWGVGFSDHRRYSLEKTRDFLRLLKNDPNYGGFTVMLGVPAYWRELKNDAISDPLLHEIIAEADIISPWTVGRYGTPEGARQFIERQTVPDMKWCEEHHVEYLPVVFPGFSWQNLQKGRGQDAPFGAIPRLKGEFLETQYRANTEAGAAMIYQAMFDELDEGTAIFKCTPTPPSGESRFLTNDGLPSDFYLELVGKWTQILKNRNCPSRKDAR